MAIIRVNWSSTGQYGEAFCYKCEQSIGRLDWEEVKFLARTKDGAVCFDCEADGASDLYPTALVMALEDAWRLVLGDMVFYGEWADYEASGGVRDDRFLIPWDEMVVREIEKDGEFIELPKSWFEGENGLFLPCLVSANLKKFQDSEDYCEA